MVQVINALNSNNFGIIIDLATILKKYSPRSRVLRRRKRRRRRKEASRFWNYSWTRCKIDLKYIYKGENLDNWWFPGQIEVLHDVHVDGDSSDRFFCSYVPRAFCCWSCSRHTHRRLCTKTGEQLKFAWSLKMEFFLFQVECKVKRSEAILGSGCFLTLIW